MGYFFGELKRRNVLRVAIVYLAASWLVIQIVETLFPIFELSDELIRLIVILLMIGFPLALLFSWAYELTPDGLKLESQVDRSLPRVDRTTKTLDRAIIVILVLALGYFAIDKFVLDPVRDSSKLAAARQEGRIEALSESHRESSIAVLPFADLSPEADHQYFADGLAEELLNLLARVPGLRVTSRTSSFSFADSAADIASIASALDVAYILEGSVRRFEDRVRITAQLIATDRDTHLWSETFDRQMDDIFRLQDEIAALVIESLQITLAGKAPVTTPTDPAAYSQYLQARHLWRQGSVESVDSAFQLLQSALELDPEFAPAWEALSTVYTYQVDNGQLPFEEGYLKAREAITRALDIDPDFALAHSALGWDAMIYDGDFETAASHFRKALQLAPSNPTVLANSATLLAVIGRPVDAVELLNQAISIDPIDSAKYTNLGAFQMAAKELGDADASLSKALELSPGDIWTQQAFIHLRILEGRPEEALILYKQIEAQTSEVKLLPMIYHDLGRHADAAEALAKLENSRADDLALEIAEVHAWQGNTDDAFEWLQRAIDGNQGAEFVRVSPFVQSLESDPRWNAIMSSLELSDDQVSKIEF